MTTLKALVIIAVCTLFCTVLGASVGFGLGKFVPNYYRSVAVEGREATFDSIAFGVGQGTTQGVVGGIIVGLALVAILSWREIRRLRMSGITDSISVAGQNGYASTLRILFITGAAFACIFCFGVGLLIGGLDSTRMLYHRQFLEEQRLLTFVLESDPAYAQITISEYSGGGAYLSGKVQNENDYQRLRITLTKAFNEFEASNFMAANRMVDTPAPATTVVPTPPPAQSPSTP